MKWTTIVERSKLTFRISSIDKWEIKYSNLGIEWKVLFVQQIIVLPI